MKLMLLPTALLCLGLGVAAIPGYLLLFDASSTIRQALAVSMASSNTSEFASGKWLELQNATGPLKKQRIARDFLARWQHYSPGTEARITADGGEIPYAFTLLGLHVTMIVGIEVGLFSLSLCNVLVFPLRSPKD